MARRIRGRNITARTRVKLWFMPEGTTAVDFKPYHGTLAHLWPTGARIITFRSNTKSGLTAMTVGNDDIFELAD